MIKLKSMLPEQIMLKGGDASTILKLEKCIGYGMDGTDEECVYKILETLKYEDLIKMDKYFKSKGFKDTIHYIIDDFSEGHELDEVLNLLFNIFEEANKRGQWPYGDRYNRFIAHRYGKEYLGVMD